MTSRMTLVGATLALAAVLAAGAGPASAAGSACPSSNPPNELVLVSGGSQTAQLGKPFASTLQVQLANTNGCALTGNLGGTTVVFVAPAGGASGIFAGSGSNRAVVGTNAQGIATAPAFTANFTAGSYGVYAESDYGTVRFDLSNTARGLPASIAASGTTSQEAMVNSQYAEPLQARVTDADGLPVQGATVSFSIVTGATGAGGSFLGGGPATATTDSNGVATSPPLLANGAPGRFTAVASTADLSAVAVYALDNHAAAITIAAMTASDPAAAVGTRYGQPLQAEVLDASGQPVEGASVTFALASGGIGGSGSSGASGSAGASFLTGTAQATELTDANGVASSPPLVANTTAGGFTATATTAGASRPATFTLENLAGVAHTVVAGAATGTSATVTRRFPVRLAVTVTDENGNPVPGATVVFVAPAKGPSGRFTIHVHKKPATSPKNNKNNKKKRKKTPRVRKSRTVRVATNANGIAIAPAFTANANAGGYVVLATVKGTSKRAAFALVNEPQ